MSSSGDEGKEAREAKEADEARRRAEARLEAYEKVVRRVDGTCPPLFSMKGVEALFAGRGLEELVRRPFIGRCVLLEKGGAACHG